MNQHRRKGNIKRWWVSILLGIAYSSLLYSQRSLTGSDDVDGIIGVLLGLYICSHPAAHVVDILFFRGVAQHPFPSRRSAVLWLALNMIILLIGWIVIFFGTTRLIGRAD